MSPPRQQEFGNLPTGQAVEAFVLENGRGLSCQVIAYGGIVTHLRVPDRHGNAADIVLGFDNLQQYLAGHPYFGCIAGRVAGRLSGGAFTLDGRRFTVARNDPPNHLHGGNIGFDKRLWQAEPLSQGPAVRMTYFSPDGEEGYPGNVNLNVTYSLTPENEFIIEYEATTDKPTPLNLTHHSYFNLAGEGSGPVNDHVLQIFADEYAPADDAMTLLDRCQPVDANDFRQPRRLGDVIPHLWKKHGDVYFITRSGPTGALAEVLRLFHPGTGRVMTIASTEPCLQLYTGAGLDGSLVGKSGCPYGPHSALCLECERYPNGANCPTLGDIILRPGQVYRQTTVHTFTTD